MIDNTLWLSLVALLPFMTLQVYKTANQILFLRILLAHIITLGTASHIKDIPLYLDSIRLLRRALVTFKLIVLMNVSMALIKSSQMHFDWANEILAAAVSDTLIVLILGLTFWGGAQLIKEFYCAQKVVAKFEKPNSGNITPLAKLKYVYRCGVKAQSSKQIEAGNSKKRETL